MKYLVFGSLNIDKVYSLKNLPEKGETLSCEKYELHVGGKGLNQAISLSKSGVQVYMAGCVGKDGKMLTDFLSASGVDTEFVKVSDGFTGHAVIEVDKDGQNQMILFKGANHEITKEDCDAVLENFKKGDLMVLQYETSNVEYMINKAHEKGIKIALNPSPYVEEIINLPLNKVDFLILNESEGMSISKKNTVDEAVNELKRICPDSSIIMTLGADGAIYADNKIYVKVPAFKVNAVDTTGAGDTFTGYFLNDFLTNADPKQALIKASAASAIVVGKYGAAETIPENAEVEKFLSENK
ncbi:MAG: ribokinase [Clostridia bacterium]|nr:ribokinase [Clostridia bacterium]